MKTIIYNLILFSLLFTFSTKGNAQESEVTPKKTFDLSGSVDTYLRYNFSEDQLQAPGTSFANQPGFAIGMANLISSYSGEKSGFVADLVFGPRGNDAVFGSTVGSSPIVNQLYVYFNLNEKLTLTLGNFNTFLGYEVIAPAANFNYSTSYMFSYGPFSHTGIKADIALNEDWSLMLGLLNPTDMTEFNAVDQYMFGAQLGYKGQFLNFLAGMGQTQIDFTGGFDLSESFFLGINATDYDSGEDSGFAGVALYPQLNVSESFAVGLRFEAFSDDSYVFDQADVDNTSLTLTGSFTSGNMIFKPEIRLDSASEQIFTGADLDPADNLASFVVAAIYSF
ncbi:MAG: outer membrane beta-barrel protein [Flavobacteriaceae bacterium]